MKKLHGVVCASITPMMPDGSIDLESAKSLYRYLADKGIHCLYPNGTNGESLSLTYEERCQLAETCAQTNQGRCVLYIQCGAGTVAETKANILAAKELDVDGVGIMTPVFFPVDEAGMEEYFDDMIQAAGEKLSYVYNIASRTGNDVSSALLGRLMNRYEGLQGIKFSSPDLLRLAEYVHCADRDVDVLIGCDSLAIGCMDLGGAGWVSGPGAVFADCFVRLYREIQEGDWSAAKKTQKQIADLGKGMAGIPEIPAIKYMLCKLGVIRYDVCRAPLRKLTDVEKARLDKLLEDYLAAEGL